jgi:hypothetical protein
MAFRLLYLAPNHLYSTSSSLQFQTKHFFLFLIQPPQHLLLISWIFKGFSWIFWILVEPNLGQEIRASITIQSRLISPACMYDYNQLLFTAESNSQKEERPQQHFPLLLLFRAPYSFFLATNTPTSTACPTPHPPPRLRLLHHLLDRIRGSWISRI